MDIKTIEKIQARMEMDTDYQDDLKSYKKMVNMEYELPDEWKTKQWVRKQISTDAHDAVKMATNIYDTNKPVWEILPRGIADVSNAEELETALEWWMQRANKLGTGEPFRKSLHNSLLQNRVIYNLDYLPYWLPKDKKKWNKEQKAAMKASSFCVTCLDASEVWYEIGKYGLKWVAHVSVVSAQDAINHWSVYESDSKEGKKVKSALAKLKNDDYYISVEYTSYDKREVSLFPTSSETLNDFDSVSESSERIDVMDVENKLSFINWRIVEGESTPLLYSMHKGGLWSNQCLYDTLITSTTARRAVMPIIKHVSANGKELDIEYRGEHDIIDLSTGEQVEFLVPPPIDQAMSQLSTMNSSKMAQASGIKGLASIEIAGNVQYAAIDAVIKLHMTSLVPYVRTVEKANAQLAEMAFLWLQQGDGFIENAYRTDAKGEKPKGEEILVDGNVFNFDGYYIQCSLKANTPTDKMQEVNMATSLQQAGAHISWKRTLESLNLGNGDVLESEWLDEQAVTIALQNKIKQLDAEIQMKVTEYQAQIQQAQQMQQQQMQQQQAAQQGQEPATQRNPMMPRGQGANAAAGGEPTGTSVPGSTSPVEAQ